MIDQRELTHRFNEVSMRTGEQLLKLMAYLAEATANHLQQSHIKHMNQGEQSIKTFMKYAQGSKDYKDFAESEINFTKLKAELKKYGVNFAHEDLPNGKQRLWFKARDENVLASACEKVKSSILENPKKAKDKLAKKASDLTVKEQINKHKKKQPKAKKPRATKTKGKGL